MKHRIMMKNEAWASASGPIPERDKVAPYSDVGREVEIAPVIAPPGGSPLPWFFQSGFGWSKGMLVLCAADHGRPESGEGFATVHNTVLSTATVRHDKLLYLATAGNYFPRTVELVKQAQASLEAEGFRVDDDVADVDGNFELERKLRALLKELGVL